MAPSERASAEVSAAHSQLLADAHALTRLAQTPEWGVLERLIAEHVARLVLALQQRGLGPVETEGLRAELAAVEWLRSRPSALQRAVEDAIAVETAQAQAEAEAMAARTQVMGPEPFAIWVARQPMGTR
jgi:hypothetical protein